MLKLYELKSLQMVSQFVFKKKKKDMAQSVQSLE